MDVEHQPTDLAVGGSNPSRRAPTPQVNGLGLLPLLVMVYAGRDPLTGKKKWVSQVRDANRALYMLAVSRLRWDPRTRAYVAGGPGRARPLLRSSVPQAAPGATPVLRHAGPTRGGLTAIEASDWSRAIAWPFSE